MVLFAVWGRGRWRRRFRVVVRRRRRQRRRRPEQRETRLRTVLLWSGQALLGEERLQLRAGQAGAKIQLRFGKESAQVQFRSGQAAADRRPAILIRTGQAGNQQGRVAGVPRGRQQTSVTRRQLTTTTNIKQRRRFCCMRIISIP